MWDRADALGDSRNADSPLGDRQEGEGTVPLPPSESHLVQQSVSSSVLVLAELPVEETTLQPRGSILLPAQKSAVRISRSIWIKRMPAAD
jgi:hypothetical protein